MSNRNQSDRYAVLALALLVIGAVLASGLGVLEQAQGQLSANAAFCVAGKECSAYQNWWADTLPNWLMAIFAILATGVGAWTVWLLNSTLAATRKSNKINRKIGQTQLRAYVAIEKVGFRAAEGEFLPTVVMDFKNLGQTPALNVRSSIKATFVFAGDGPSPPEISERRGFPLAPSQTRSTTHIIRGIGASILNNLKASGGMQVFVTGRIDYFDVFGREQWTTFKGWFHFDPEGQPGSETFVISAEGNDAT